MLTGIRIGRLTPDDIRAASALEERSFGREGWTEKDFVDTLALDYAFYYAAWEEDRLVGMAGARLIAGEAYISNVSVEADRRRSGIAQALMNTLMDELRKEGATAYTLEVRSGNKPATALYKKLGFDIEGVRKGFYSNPVEDALIMWKR